MATGWEELCSAKISGFVVSGPSDVRVDVDTIWRWLGCPHSAVQPIPAPHFPPHINYTEADEWIHSN